MALSFVGCSLWREDRSVICTYCWPLPAQSFSGPSPLRLATIFYCLRFETFFFVASYDSRGHGGGIRPRFHTGFEVNSSQVKSSQSHIATDGQSVSKSWCRVPSGAHGQIFIAVWQLRSCFCGAPSLTRGRVCLLYMLLALVSAVFPGSSPLGLATIFYFLQFETSLFVTSYDSQGHGEGIRPRLHTGSLCTESESFYDRRSVGQSALV
jgi:hypothetical protein